MKTIKQLIEEMENVRLKGDAQHLYVQFEHKLRTSPASTRFHQSYEGGLYDHIELGMNVVDTLYDFLKSIGFSLGFTKDDAMFVYLIHDFGKTELYRQVSPGVFKYIPNKPSHEMLCKILLREQCMTLSSEHDQAVTFHHGGWSTAKQPPTLSQLTYFTHICDLIASQFGRPEWK